MTLLVQTQKAVTQPAPLICLGIVLLSTAYFAVHGAMFYADLDFSTRDLGQSKIADFFVFYSSARFLWEGGAVPDLYNGDILKAFQVSLGAAEEGRHPFNYPPTYLLLIWPFGGLPYAVALIIWQVLTLAFFALVLRGAGLRPLEVLAVIAAPVTILNFSGGQNGCLTSALFIGGLALLTRRQSVSGSLFGLLTIKPHLGLLVPVVCLAGRRWQAIVAAATIAIVLIGVTIAVFGSSSWWAYFDFLGRFQAQAQAQTSSEFLNFSVTVLMAEQILGLPKTLAYGIQAAISVGVCGAVYRAYRRSADETLRLILVLVGASLVTPFGFVYDLPFMAVAVILAVRVGLRTGFLPFEVFCLSSVWLLPFFGDLTAERGVPLTPWIHLVFFGFVLARLRQANRQTIF